LAEGASAGRSAENARQSPGAEGLLAVPVPEGSPGGAAHRLSVPRSGTGSSAASTDLSVQKIPLCTLSQLVKYQMKVAFLSKAVVLGFFTLFYCTVKFSFE